LKTRLLKREVQLQNYQITQLPNPKPGQPSNHCRTKAVIAYKKGKSSANQFIELTASQGRNVQQETRGARHGQWYGQDVNARP
jgi:hypothetical protein